MSTDDTDEKLLAIVRKIEAFAVELFTHPDATGKQKMKALKLIKSTRRFREAEEKRLGKLATANK